MVEDEPDPEELETHGRNDEEVHRRNGALVIAKERQPGLASGWIRRASREVAQDRGQADRDAELRELTVDLSRTPGVLERHPLDEFSYLLGDARPPGATAGDGAPLEPEALPVPTNHRLWLDNDQHVPPRRLELAERDSEGAIQGAETRSAPGVGVSGELLTERQLDEGLLASATEARGDRPKERGHE